MTRRSWSRRERARRPPHSPRRSDTIAVLVNVPVVCAGVQVVPGDVVVADDDGVVVVRRVDAVAVARAGEAREEKEAATRARLEKGELGLDIYGMRKALADRGLRYVDGPAD